MIITSSDGDEFFDSPDPVWLQSWRAQPNNEAHWKIFLTRYFPYIEMRVAQYAPKPQDKEDLQQEILSKILINIQSMEPLHKDGFRHWLKQLVNSALCNWFEGKKKRRAISLMDPATIQDIAKETTHNSDEDYYLELMRKAIIQVRFDPNPPSWGMFQ